MKPAPVRYMTEDAQPEITFSVCSLVASEEKYQRLISSFTKNGFDASNTEFIAIDNRGNNRFDGYRALRAAISAAKGEFILYTHDDIELVDDDADTLLSILRDLDARDPNWTLAGNAGWTIDHPERLMIHLRDPHGTRRDVDEPKRVGGLDENFLILPRKRLVLPSLDLSGFHLFATDLCQQSLFVGGSAWVIPFFLHHHSSGSHSSELEASKAAFERKYGMIAKRPRVRAPATTMYLRYPAGFLARLSDSVYWTCRNGLQSLRRKAKFFFYTADEPGGTYATASLRG